MGRKDEDHDGNTIPNIEDHDGNTLPEINPHDGNTIMEGPLPEGAFDEVRAEMEAEAAAEEPQPEPPPAPKLERPTAARRKLGEGGTKMRRSSITKEMKPPSKVGKTIKKIFILGIPVLIIGLIAAGFIVKDHNQDMVWVALLKKFNVIKGDPRKKDKGPEVAAKQLDFDAVQSKLKYIEDRVNRVSPLVDTGKWTKESALAACQDLTEAADVLEKAEKEFAGFDTWFTQTFLPYVRAVDAKDDAKIKELDPQVGANRNMKVEENEVNSVRARLETARDRVARLRNGFPTKAEIEEGKLPTKDTGVTTKKDHTGTKTDDPVKKDDRKEYDVFKLNPWAGLSPGTWRRSEKIEENLIALTERKELYDLVYQSTDKEKGVNLQRYALIDDKEVGPTDASKPMSQLIPKFVKYDTLEIQGAKKECAIVESAGGRAWILLDGPLPGRLAVKHEGSEISLAAVEVGEREIKVKDRTIKCAYVEMNGTIQGLKAVQRGWFSEDVPGWQVRVETEKGDFKTTLMLLDHGVGERPPFKSDTVKKDDKTDEPKKLELPNTAHPWESAREGTWMRSKTTFKQGDFLSESFTDASIVKVEPTQVTVKYDTLTAGGEETSNTQVIPLTGDPFVPVKEEAVQVGGTTYAAILAEKGGTRIWIGTEGIVRGRMLRMESAATKIKVTKVAEDSLNIDGRAYACFYYESEDSSGNKSKTWLSGEIAGGLAKSEMQLSGGGWSSTEVRLVGEGERPPFAKKDPVVKKDDLPKETPVDEIIEEAGTSLAEGTARFKDLAKAYREGLPSDKAQLRALKEKAETAEMFLKGAQEGYEKAKARGAGASAMDERLSMIRKALGLLKKYRDAIEAKLAE